MPRHWSSCSASCLIVAWLEAVDWAEDWLMAENPGPEDAEADGVSNASRTCG